VKRPKTLKRIVERSFHVPYPSRLLLAPGMKPTPAHNLINYGGKTISDLCFTTLYIGGPESWKASDTINIDQAIATAMSDRNLNNVMQQYFGSTPITSTFAPSRELPGPKPTTFSQGDVEKLTADLYAADALAAFDLTRTVFCFVLPSGSILTTDAAPSGPDLKAFLSRSPVQIEDKVSSLEGLGGYHGSIHVGGVTLYYAIAVYSEVLPDGTQNGIVAFATPWKNVVATLYHELNEARTDPDVEDAINGGSTNVLGWMSAQGEECGDFPVFEAGAVLSEVMFEVPLSNGRGTVPVQLMYSNADRGPGMPIAAPPTISRWQRFLEWLRNFPLIGKLVPAGI